MNSLIHVFILMMYVHGAPDVLSVHATLAGCERAQRSAESTEHGKGLIYVCTTVSVAP